MTSFKDGINAAVRPWITVRDESSVKKNDVIKIKMARNGGFAAVIE